VLNVSAYASYLVFRDVQSDEDGIYTCYQIVFYYSANNSSGYICLTELWYWQPALTNNKTLSFAIISGSRLPFAHCQSIPIPKTTTMRDKSW